MSAVNVKNAYATKFDSLAYASALVLAEDLEQRWVVEDFLHRIFKQGKLRGETLLDVGCGPTIRATISASAYVSEIYLSDFVARNRLIVQKWLDNDPDALDYSQHFKHVAELEEQADYKLLEERARSVVKGILPCDIMNDDNPLHPRPYQQFDIVTSFLCLDCYPDIKDYCRGMRNLAGLVKKGGHLVLNCTKECTTYTLSSIKFPNINLDSEKISKVVTEVGLEIREMNEHLFSDQFDICDSDIKGFITVLAVKL